MMQPFGALNGTHIQIMAPSTKSQDYLSYKYFHSLNAQAVCNYRDPFLDP